MDEDAVTATPEDYPPRLEPWKLAELKAEEAEFEAEQGTMAVRENEEDDLDIIQEHRVVEESIAMKFEEDRASAAKGSAGTIDSEASGGSGEENVEIINISDSNKE
jgi:hypothetical protein